MPKNKFTFLNAIIIACALAVVIAIFSLIQLTLNNDKPKTIAGNSQPVPEAQDSYQESTADILKINDDDHVWGDKNSPVRLVIYEDFQCPFCTDFYDTIEEAKKEFAGKIAIVMRHNPLPSHFDAFPAAVAAECAGEQGKFWEMYGKLFEDSKANLLNVSEYKKDAKELELDQEKYDSCLDSEKYKEKIAGQMLKAKEVGAFGTPTFFVNDKIYPGAYPMEDFTDQAGDNNKGLRNIILGELDRTGLQQE